MIIKKLIIGIILFLGLSNFTFGDTVVENSGRDYITSYYNYSEQKQYYVSGNVEVSLSTYLGVPLRQHTSIVIADSYNNETLVNMGASLVSGSTVWNMWNESNYADGYRIIENSKLLFLFTTRLKIGALSSVFDSNANNLIYDSVIVIDKTTNQYQNLKLNGHGGYIGTPTEFYFNKDKLVLQTKNGSQYINYDLINEVGYVCHEAIEVLPNCPILTDLVANENLFEAPFKKYILSNDKKNFVYNNLIDDRLDYYSFDENNIRTDNINFFPFTGSNTENLWYFQQQSLNNNYVQHNAELSQILDLNITSLGSKVLLGFSGSTLLTVPYSNTNNFPTYDINGDTGNYLAGISYINSEWVGSYVQNNVLYRVTDNTIINYTETIIDTIDGSGDGLSGSGFISSPGADVLGLECPVELLGIGNLEFTIPLFGTYTPFDSFDCFFSVAKTQLSPINGESFSGFLDLSNGTNRLVMEGTIEEKDFNGLKVGDILILVVVFLFAITLIKNKNNG